jgi:hypothetical protein
VTFSVAAEAHLVRVHIDVPSRSRPPSIALRLRLPGGRRILSVSPRRPFDAASGTIYLHPRAKGLDFLVRIS